MAMHEVTQTAHEVTLQFMGLLKTADARAEKAEASVVALKSELSMERTSAKTRGKLLDMSIEDGAEKVTEIHALEKRIADLVAAHEVLGPHADRPDDKFGPCSDCGISPEIVAERVLAARERGDMALERVAELDAKLAMVVDGACALSGPGRGDCEHFVGLPGKSIPDQHDGPDDTVDHRGKPNGWCQRCWDVHIAGKAHARVEELDFQLCDGMPARASTNDPVPQDGKRYRVFTRARIVEWESGPNVWVGNGEDGAWYANNCDGWLPDDNH